MFKKLRCFLLILLVALTGIANAQGYMYENREYGVSIVFPDGWAVDKEFQSKTILAVSRNHEGESINLAVEMLPKQYNNCTFKGFSRKELKDYAIQLERKLLSINHTIKMDGWDTKLIDGQTAVWFLLSMPVPTSTAQQEMKILHVQVMHNAKLYMITCGTTAEKYRNFKPVFSQTVNSLKFSMPGISL